jgi:hypothetical protein
MGNCKSQIERVSFGSEATGTGKMPVARESSNGSWVGFSMILLKWYRAALYALLGKLQRVEVLNDSIP